MRELGQSSRGWVPRVVSALELRSVPGVDSVFRIRWRLGQRDVCTEKVRLREDDLLPPS